MARRGGYTRDVAGIEWAKLSQQRHAEGVLSAASMGQDFYTWMNDAVAHHAYRCEMIQAKQRYQEDELAARQSNAPTPDPNDRRYQVNKPVPTITRPEPGGMNGGSRGPRARP